MEMRTGRMAKAKLKKKVREPELIDIFALMPFQVSYYDKVHKRDSVREIALKPNPKQIALEDLQNYVEDLKKRYPKEGFCIEETENHGKKFWVLKKNARKPKFPEVPLYFNLESQRVFIERSLWNKRRRLCLYILFRTLGSLGLTQARFVS